MKRRRKPVTKELIRKYFGPRARISSRWFAGGYRITTESGGELLVSDDEFTVLVPTDDVFRCMTMLAHEVWGGMTVQGSHEFVMAWMAHGEALGVNVTPGVKRGWFWRSVMILGVIAGILVTLAGDSDGITLAAVAGFIWWRIERSAKRKQQQFAAEVSYAFPRVHGTATAASDQDLEREGWL